MAHVLYYAAPLFTAAERDWNTANCLRLRRRFPACEVAVPQEFCAAFDNSPTPDFARIFAACVGHLATSTAVLAVLDGPDPDSGTCWEAGYAYAKGLPVVGLRTDWRPAEDGVANCMLTRSCLAVARNLDEACIALDACLH